MNKFLLILTFAFFTCSLFGQDEHIGCHHHNFKPQEPVPGFFPPVVDDTRSDSIDIINYTIDIDVTQAPYIRANTIVTASPIVDNIGEIELDLLQFQIDSVFVDGIETTYEYDGFQIYVDLPVEKQTGEDFDVQVFYQGIPTRDASNFGGLVTENGYIYNLGIGIAANPHNYGRGWFPCFDNFMERSTYEYIITHKNEHSAHCVGTEISVVNNAENKTTTYVMAQQITTYQSSIAIAPYTVLWSEHEGLGGTIPIKLMCMPSDTNRMKASFGNLTGAIDAMESWYGPDVWERVGYVITTVGAMEHPTNIAYPVSSIQNSNADANTRLVAHELTHNWFGNMVTLSTERDMWIKEGPAEYGWHLTAEHIYGKDEFLNVVKDNHQFVLERAHLDDEIFRALSGMPNEFTYGTHTYRKGASVIHNLRGYLGDDLFKVGMNSILDNYLYSHLDAEEFENEITSSTGIDMSEFFEAWVLNPGFSVFVEDSIKSIDNGDGTYTNELHVQQKLRGTDKFHKSVPLVVHAYGADDQISEHNIMLSGQYDIATIDTDFEIERITINRDNILNQSRMAEDMVITEDGNHKFERTDITFRVEEYVSPITARVEHIYAEPDQNVEGDFEISNGHYWRIMGDLPAENEVGVNFLYDGSGERDFDYNLVEFTEDSMLLMFRIDASQPWRVVEEAVHNKGIPIDGVGLLRLSNLVVGEYTFGKGVLEVTSTQEISEKEINIYPNPAINETRIHMEGDRTTTYSLSVTNIQGQLLFVDNQVAFAKRQGYLLNTDSFSSGNYILRVVDTETGEQFVQKLVVVK